MLRYILAFFIGVIAGQYAMRHAYDPDTLEQVALEFSAQAYYAGCISQPGIHAPEPHHDFCNQKAQKFLSDNKSIWHDKAWKKL